MTSYLPGPPGVGGDFWVGDTVTLHSGPGPFDYSEKMVRVLAITVSREDDNAELVVLPELSSPGSSPLCTGYTIEWGSASQGATWSSQDAPNWPTTDFDNPANAAYDVAGVTHLTAGVTYVGEMWVPLDVDLGSARIVNRLILDADYNDWNVVVQSSDDGVSYQTVLPEFHIVGDPETIDLAAPVRARYWRFLHHWINPDGDGHWHYYGSQMYQYVSLWGCE